MNDRNRTLPPLTAARQTGEMVGQTEALAQIRDAIYADDDEFHVVFLRAQGGMGKSRLLEETQKKVAEEWGELGDTAVSDLIDVIDIRLHARDRFIRELYDSLRRPETADVTFRTYTTELDKLTVLRASGAQLQRTSKVVQQATQAFLADLAEITRRRRVAWIVDTVEQLSYITSQWALEHDLLQPKDLQGRTHQWLKEFIGRADLRNVTLILAGRGEEGETFFESMETAVREAQGQGLPRRRHDIKLGSLTRPETRAYFAELAGDWKERAANGDKAAQRIARQFEWIARETNDRADVLWLYTDGVPVRLALYAQLIVEGRDIPDPLKLSFSQALQEANLDETKIQNGSPIEETRKLRKLRWDIEDEFINILFQDPTDRRTRILQTLVRAPRGLNALQLHYILDNEENLSPEEWHDDPRQLQELTTLLQEMGDYYLVKRRAPWEEFDVLFSPEEQEAATFRLGLQDEIYRIFAEHMAPHTEPRNPDIDRIWQDLPESERQRYTRNREAEKRERQDLYRRLRDWAAAQHETYLHMKREFMLSDERELELQLVRDRPRTFYFEQLGDHEARRREAINQAIDTFEIERMTYDLLLDPERNLNESYIDLGTRMAKANQEEFDFWAQTEMWRIIRDPYSLKFVDFRPRERAERYEKEPVIEVLYRAVEQEDVSRWLKRFVLRGEFQRAIDFGQQAELIIQQFPQETKREELIYHSWNHTVVHVERRSWVLYAHIYLARQMPDVLSELEDHLENLKRLYETPVIEPAVFRPDGHIEHGFRASANKPAHPALTRLRRQISMGYNTLGYGYIMSGQVREAVKCYGHALYYVRGDKGVMSHRAVVLNNLSRALSDLGRNSVSVCLDGLNIKRDLAEEVPLAISYNTLALIYDDMDRYEESPELAAKAIAYLRRAGARRGLGLALIQMGESLRHLAIRAQRGEMVQATPDTLYAAAERLLREARTIFSTEIEEAARQIIVAIEVGSLYRDRLRPTPMSMSPRQRQDIYREALLNLETAKEMAVEHGLHHLKADADVNIAWTHFYARQFPRVGEAIEQMKADIDPVYFITPTYQPDVENRELVHIFWATRQLSKANMLQGRVALKRFTRLEDELKEKYPGEENARKRHRMMREDETAQEYLAQAAEAYALSLGYTHILSPGGRILEYTLDDLYTRIRAFNRFELDALHEQVVELRKRYKALASIEILDQFLHEFFGIPDHELSA